MKIDGSVQSEKTKPILKRMNVNFCARGCYDSKPAIRVACKPTFTVWQCRLKRCGGNTSLQRRRRQRKRQTGPNCLLVCETERTEGEKAQDDKNGRIKYAGYWNLCLTGCFLSSAKVGKS